MLTNKTCSTINVDELIANLNTKEIEFATINQLVESSKLSKIDFGRIVAETTWLHEDNSYKHTNIDMIKKSWNIE